MIIGFKKQFVSPILKGTKKHTIREDIHNRWKPGMLMHMATGVRTKQYNCFKKDKCISTQKISIVKVQFLPKQVMGMDVHFNESDTIILLDKDTEYYCVHSVSVDGKKLTNKEVEELSRNDGFESIEDFFQWFSGNFEGKIIHWTDKKY